MNEQEFLAYLDLATKQLDYKEEDRSKLYSTLKELFSRHTPDELRYLLDKWEMDRINKFNSGHRKRVERDNWNNQ